MKTVIIVVVSMLIGIGLVYAVQGNMETTKEEKEHQHRMEVKAQAEKVVREEGPTAKFHW